MAVKKAAKSTGVQKKQGKQEKAAPRKVEKQTTEEVFISEADQYVFAQGTHYDIYKKLGAHPSVENGEKGMFFAVWAPNAASVHVIGTFNGWDEEKHEMEKLGPGGIYKLFDSDAFGREALQGGSLCQLCGDAPGQCIQNL